MKKISKKGVYTALFIFIALFLFSWVFVWMQVGKAKRDRELLEDIRLIGTLVPSDEVVGTSHQTWNEWDIQSYLVRYDGISLDDIHPSHRFFVIQKNQPENSIPDGYVLCPLKTKQLNLYRKP